MLTTLTNLSLNSTADVVKLVESACHRLRELADKDNEKARVLDEEAVKLGAEAGLLRTSASQAASLADRLQL